jgi:WD40 repeat protein
MPIMLTCPKCGVELPPDASADSCPNCILSFAAESETIAASHEHIEGALPFTGRRFGDYELLEEIARGGMGVVYKARQVSLDRIVAVKMLLAGPLAGKDFVQRFRTEAAAAASLQHPNIVAIHEVGFAEGQHFFAMDYVEGLTLAQLVANGPLSARQAATYLQTIAEAIHFAHERNVLHRDLKPSNVLIDSGTDQPRVTDFGLAKRLEAETDLTLSGQVLGSPNYMSPEQALGKRGTVGKRSDVYSLGAILYHLVTGRPPFQGETLTDVLHQVVNAEPVSPRLLNPSVPVDLETVCLKCLEKEPEKRYATAQQLADELDRFLNDEPIHARPVTRVERAWRWCRRKPALAGSLAIAALLLLIVAIGSPIAALRINRLRLDTQHEAQRAEAGETVFRLSAYAADMNVAHTALQEQLSRAMQLLERWTNAASSSAQSPTPVDLRGWEWRYLRSQCRTDERATLTRPDARHSGITLSVVYSQDGNWVASGSHDGRVKLFDLSTRTQIWEFAHERAVSTVAFSPRDSTLATLCADGFLRFWDVHTRSNIGGVSASASVDDGALAFSRDGSWLAFSDARNGWVTVSNLTTGTSFTTNAHTGSLTGLAFSPDSTLLATRAWDGTIKLWEVRSWRLKHVLSHQGWGWSTVAFSPDGRQLVSTSIDQMWKLWDTESGRLLHAEKSRFGHPLAAVFLSDGKTIAVANMDDTIRLWHQTADGWKERAVLKVRSGTLALALSPDGTELASSTGAGEVKLWSTTPPAEPSDWMPLESGFKCLSTDARAFLVAFTNGVIELWDSATLTNTATLTWPETNAVSFALHSDGKTIVSGSEDGTIKLWRLAGRSLREERDLKFGTNRVTHVALSPNEKTIAAASSEKFILWDVESGQRLLEFDQVDTWSLKFSPDSTLLVSTSRDGKVKLWRVANGGFLWKGEHNFSATDAAFFPDGKWIVSGGWDNKPRLWDAASGRELDAFRGQLLGADSVAVSPDGQRVAMGAGEGTVKLFLLHGSQQAFDVLTLPCQQNWVTRVAFLPDGETLVAVCRAGIQVWRAPSLAAINAKE